jgi:hypothetical protein
VADRHEMPSDCSRERSAKWSYLSREEVNCGEVAGPAHRRSVVMALVRVQVHERLRLAASCERAGASML